MGYLVIAIIGLLFLVALFTLLTKSKSAAQEEETPLSPPPDCCGAHADCEKQLKKTAPEIEYFDDEELDQFQGLPPDSYTDAQIDLFREVLYTLRPEELSDWLISLEKRRIAFPDPLKPEYFDLKGSR